MPCLPTVRSFRRASTRGTAKKPIRKDCGSTVDNGTDIEFEIYVTDDERYELDEVTLRLDDSSRTVDADATSIRVAGKTCKMETDSDGVLHLYVNDVDKPVYVSATAKRIDTSHSITIKSASQLEIARRRGLPVILHCVKAYNEMLPTLRPFDIPAVFHGFAGSKQLAGQVLKAGYYLSFGETAFRSSKTADALRNTPSDRLFLETDESAAGIGSIYERAAAIRGVSVAELAAEIRKNYRKIFAA